MGQTELSSDSFLVSLMGGHDYLISAFQVVLSYIKR